MAIIHRKRDCVKLILEDWCSNTSWAKDAFIRTFILEDGQRAKFMLEPLQLAEIIGDTSILQMLLEVCTFLLSSFISFDGQCI